MSKTTTQQHTPGPWTLDGDGFVYGEGNIVADPHSSLNIDHAELEANALLIAAAPDSLAANKLAKETITAFGVALTMLGDKTAAKNAKPALDALKAAIAKAEGRT